MEQSPAAAGYGLRAVLTILIAMLCTLLAVMDIGVVNPAFGDIRQNLGVSYQEVVWVMVVYPLAGLIMMPFHTRLSRQLGARNYFVTAIIFFTISSFLCGNAVNLQALVIFRVMQGIGAGSMLALSFTTTAGIRAVGKSPVAPVLLVMSALAGMMLAQPFGGYITDNYSWPFIFFINVPAGIIVSVLVLVCIRKNAQGNGKPYQAN